ncbi:helix-turn-helix domain-containing protein [Peribacillus sp. SCS-26]|uniref:helix-turn-helix domain-containing protein n=1 Tax=Paraperibacillus marinus TaxID=3115295 RepID=UPI003905DFFD
MEVGKRIKQIRENKGLSVREFSDRLGISHTYLSRMENGKRPIKTEFLLKVAELLDTPIEDFYPDTHKKKITVENDLDIFMLSREKSNLDGYTDEQILEFIKKGKEILEKIEKDVE